MKFFCVNTDKDVSEILVYGFIGGDDCNSGDLVREIKNLEKSAKLIRVRINSAGGSVFEGFAIFNALIHCKAEVHTYIDGVAASMGSIIALAGSKVYMSKIAKFMTHRSSGFASGNADEMNTTAKVLTAMDDAMCGIYAAKTGKSKEECMSAYLGKQDRWFTSQEALAEKLVDEIYDAEPIEMPSNVYAEADVWKHYNEHRFAAVFNNNNKQTDMVQLSPEARAALNIGDQPDVAAINGAIVAMKAKADADQTRISELEARIKDASKAAVKEMLTASLNSGAITKEAHDVLLKKYENEPDQVEELKALLATFKPFKSILPEGEGEKTAEIKALADLSYEELDRKGLLEKYKQLDPAAFAAKFEQKFGKKYEKK